MCVCVCVCTHTHAEANTHSHADAKQDERKAAKEDKKKKLLDTLKSNVKASKGGKSKQPNTPHATESRGSAQEGSASEVRPHTQVA